MSNNYQLLKQQSSRGKSNQEKSVASSLRSNMPFVSKTQLFNLILQKFEKDFKGNEQKLQRVKEIVQEHFNNNQKVTDDVIRSIKLKVKQDLEILSSNDVRKRHGSQADNSKSIISNNLLLPPINNNSIVTQNYQDLNLNNRVQTLEHEGNEDSYPELALQQNNTNSLKNITEDYEMMKELERQISKQDIEKLIKQKLESNNKYNTIEHKPISEEEANLSDRSIYEVPGGDAYALIVKKNAEKFRQEQERKKQEKIQQQKEMKELLDQMVNQKLSKATNQQIRDQQDKIKVIDLKIKEFDLKISEENQYVAKVEHEQKEHRLLQMQDIQQRRKQKRLQDQIQQQDLIFNAQRQLKEEEMQKIKKKENERKFYDDVKKEDNKYKQLQQKQFEKEKSEKWQDYDYARTFDENQKQRDQQHQQRLNLIDQVQNPLLESLYSKDAKDKQTRKQYDQFLQYKFKNDLELEKRELDIKKLKKLEWKQEMHQVSEGLKQNSQNVKNMEVQQDNMQAQIFRKQKEEYEYEINAQKEKEKKKLRDLQEFLKVQMAEQKESKKSPVYFKPSNEELLINKQNLKSIFQDDQNSSGILNKKQTSEFRHVKKPMQMVKH